MMYCVDTIDTEILHCNDCKGCMDLECGIHCPFWKNKCILIKCGMKYSQKNKN